MTRVELYESEKYHKKIVDIIHKYGTKYDKKHGNWIVLQYTNNTCFLMDSWNEGVGIVPFPIRYNYHIGTEDKHLKHLGSNFGGFNSHITLELWEFYYENINNIYILNK